MAGIKNCIAKFKDFPESLKNKLISLSDKFKSEGKAELQADTEAILAVHKELHDELNDLKRQVKEPTKKYVRPDSTKDVEKVKEKHKKEDEAKVNEDAELEKIASSGKDVNPEGMSEREYLATVLDESTSPGEIAGAWLNEYETDSSIQKNYDAGKGTTQDMIYAFFKNGGKLSKKSFELHGDKNNMDMSGRRTYFTDKGGRDADVAVSINDGTGDIKYVDAQDVIDFINDHPTGIGSYESKFGENKASVLHGKFIRLTGRRLTPKFAREVFKKYVELKEKEENTLPPMTEAEANEELANESAREKQFAETGQFQKKGKKTLSSIQLDAVKALENGEYVYYQNEQDGSIIELKSANDIVLAGENGYTDLEISKEEVDDAIPYSDFVKENNKATIDKVIERMRKVLPKFEIVENKKLDAAGRIDGNKIEINPFYADIDTPIHEVGHALIDFIGYKNRVIQAGIKQLRDTQFYKDVAAARPELTGELLDKEVLAEAIGKEGADIFETEVKKKRFKQVLDYIFTKLKQLLGIDKNIAKSLAKQIIGGIGTKGITESKEGFQKKDGEKKPKVELTEKEKKIKELYEAIKDIEDLSAVPWKDMLAAYNYLITTENYSKSPEGKKAAEEFKKRMALSFFQDYSNKVKTDPKYSPEKAAKKDIKGWDVAMKALSHFSAEFPELKGLSELYNEAFFNKVTESAEKKRTNQKLAEAVIKDRHQKLGLLERGKEGILNLFGNRNYKYFDFLEGKDGNFITVKEAEKKGLSKAQIDYLKFARNVVASRSDVVDNLGENWNNELQILRNDKKFYESFATENVVSAFSALLGNTWNINNVRIDFINPITGKEQISEYENIEKILVNYGKKGPLQKANAIRLMAKYNVRARNQLTENVNRDEKGDANVLNAIRSGDYSLTANGKLQSKFDKPRNPNRPYSKDFYSAINEYIDDTEHIQHMQPLVPIINAIDYLNKGVYDENGNEMHYKKKNVTEWLKDWSDLHILKKAAPAILGKYESENAALFLRFFRNAASLSMMMFNAPAQLRNAAMGIYNTWRKENSKTVAVGMKRLLGGTKTRYSYELIRKYKAASTDIDSNPIRTAGGSIMALGYLGTKWGEFLVQGSQFLGMMSKEDFNSFEWKRNKFGVDELVVKKGIDEKQIQKRMLDLIDRVSDVQGKYSEKDRRNIQNNELGKSIMQYRVWLPDWWRIRFSKDAGSWRNTILSDSKKLREAISKDGVVKAFWNDKNFMSNFKEVATITLLLALLYSDDEDEEKSLASKQAMKILSEMVGVVDPNNMKQLIERPVASMGVVTRVLDMFDHLIMLEADDFYSKDAKYGKEGTPKIVGDIRGGMPGKQLIDAAEEVLEDEE